MSVANAAGIKRNLLLCFDAFGTLFTPSVSIPSAYVAAAARHGIQCGDPKCTQLVAARFKHAFKEESRVNPNYGKATGLGAEKWWGNVINKTFQEFLQPDQQVPQALVTELLDRFSTKDGYSLFQDVKPFFEMLKDETARKSGKTPWMWDKTVVGIITNSDDRVPGILQSFGLKVGPRRVGTPDQRSARIRLEDDVSFVVLSYDVGVEKPDRRVFDAAVEMLQDTLAGNDAAPALETFEKLYVGDDIEKDYEGAEAAGWNSVLLRREYEKKNLRTEREYALGKAKVLRKDMSPSVVLLARDMWSLRRWRPGEGSGVD